jgi:hypothetical protein
MQDPADADFEAWTGYTISGLRLYADDNIPNNGSSQCQLIVTHPSTMVVAESSVPIVAVNPQYGAGSLQPLLTIRSYIGAVVRYASASISGAFYLASQF